MKKMHFTATKITTVLLALCSIFCLTSCSTSSVKSEADILSDIQGQDNWYHDFGLTIEATDITKRQTNKDDKTDYIWVDVSAFNDDFSYTGSYELTYILYNDGWMLEDFEQRSRAFDVKKICDQEIADIALEENYDSFLLENESSVIDNTMNFTYVADSVISEYLSQQYNVSVVCSYSPLYSWKVDQVSEELLGENWDFNGSYVYKDEETAINIEIFDFDADALTASLSYSIASYADPDSTSRSIEPGVYTSEDVINVKLTESTYGDFRTFIYAPTYLHQIFDTYYESELAEIRFYGCEAGPFVETSKGTGGYGVGIMVVLDLEHTGWDECYWLEKSN